MDGGPVAPPQRSRPRGRLPDTRLAHGDLEQLPFEDDAFDIATGFNSFQYAADPIGALQEARRVTKPGGQVFVMTWSEPAGMEAAALVADLKPLLPPPPAGAPGPFALSEPGKLEALAASAGLTPLEVLDVDAPWSYPDLATAQKGLGSSASRQRRPRTVARTHSTRLMPKPSPLFASRTAALASARCFRVPMAGVQG